MAGSVPLLRVEGLSKSFGAIRALHDVSFELEQGKILGLVGDNGAGKSTLLNMLVGRLQPSGGKIFFEGEEVRFRDPSEAMKKGIAIAYQFLDLVEIAPLWANFFMGREITRKIGPFNFLDKKKMQSLTEERLLRYGFKTDVDREVRELSGGERQILATSKAMEADPKLLLLDEPFTLLSIEDTEMLVRLIKEINKKTSTSIIVISHTLSLVKEVSHYIMLLKAGEKAFLEPADSVSIYKIIEVMLH